MSLEKLTSLVPPPAHPVGADADWTQTEAVLGLSLPADFKQVVRLYGAGQFCDELSTCPPERIIEYNQELLTAWGPLREEHSEEFPFPLYPEPGGLLVWGLDSLGGVLCWLTEGKPDEWEVVKWKQRDGEFHEWDCGAAEFLTAQIELRVEEAEEEGEAFDAPWFTPDRDLVYVYVELSEGPLPYAERLGILRERLAPTASRGSWTDDDAHQDHFVATESDWEVTYETAYGHQIRVGYPLADEERARTEILAAVEAMGCRVLSTHGDSAWDLPSCPTGALDPDRMSL
ncbi:SMI1/KNR4 family protein [Streptomyces sp. 3N207]|uniref:SMI1/KNR4 family protein n=1 Tax=Streptomyces sp. 3N207 TaxID=3457417 RepID=UPI003FD02500